MSQQTPYTIPPVENRSDMQQPTVQQQISPEYNEQFIETLAQRLMPRLMPEILYNVRVMDPARARNKSFGLSLSLAIVSLALLIPLTAIVLGIVTTLGGGITAALIGIATIGLVMVLINVLFNNALFHDKS